MENDNFLSIEEIVFLNSCLFYVKSTSPYFANNAKEKAMLEQLSSKLLSVITSTSVSKYDTDYDDDNIDEDNKVEVKSRKDQEGGKNLLLENLECKIASNILYEDLNNDLINCKLTLYEDLDSGEFEIHITDSSGETLTTTVPELALEADDKKLICIDERGDEVEINLLENSLEKLEEVLKSNLLN